MRLPLRLRLSFLVCASRLQNHVSAEKTEELYSIWTTHGTLPTTHLFQSLLRFLMCIERDDFDARCPANGLQKNWSILPIVQRNERAGAVYPANEYRSMFAEVMNEIGLFPVFGESNVKHVVTIRHSCNGEVKKGKQLSTDPID